MNTIEGYETLTQTEKHEATSERYAMVPTSRMLDILSDYGWHPSKVQEAYTRKAENRGFQKHIVRLRNDAKLPVIVGEYIPEIILINSHMGSSAFQLMAGVYRLVCSNGLMVGDTWESERVTHRGFATAKAETAIQNIVKALPMVTDAVESFRATPLNESERLAYAESAIELINDGDKVYSMRPDSLITPRRWADKSDQSLWGTFNVVQENIIRGGVRRVDSVGRRTRTRAINSIDRGVTVNRALWTLTEKMAELKKAA